MLQRKFLREVAPLLERKLFSSLEQMRHLANTKIGVNFTVNLELLYYSVFVVMASTETNYFVKGCVGHVLKLPTSQEHHGFL